METKISIYNENLSNYIKFKLDKIENEFTQEELDKIDEVIIDYNIEDESSFIFLNELTKFNNLKSVTLRNGYIFNDNYSVFSKLNNLTNFTFDNCEFENANLITTLNLKSLSLINCKINNYKFINSLKLLEELSIVSGNNVEIEKINKLENLKYLQISYSYIADKEPLNALGLKELYIDNTNIEKFDFLNNLKELKRIGIDNEQYKNNREIFDNLRNKNISVLNESIAEFEDINDKIRL